MAGRHALPCLQRRLGQIAGRGTSRMWDEPDVGRAGRGTMTGAE
jgi:hypothetical protein